MWSVLPPITRLRPRRVISAGQRRAAVRGGLCLVALLSSPIVLGQAYHSSISGSSSSVFVEAPSESAIALDLNQPARTPSNLAMEVDHWDLGELMHSSGLINTSGVNLSARAAWPVARQWSMYSKLGVFLWQTQDVAARQLGALQEGAAVTYAGGMAWSVAESVALNVEYKVFELNGLEGDGLGFGLSYRF